MKKHNGWLFDLYEHPTKGVVLWIVGEAGKPYSFHQVFETVFYARGPIPQLHNLGKWIRSKYSRGLVRLERVTKEDLFDGPQEVMGIGISNPAIFKKLFREASESFSDLIFYDVDTPLTVRYAAAKNVFMMARCEVEAESDGRLVSIKALDTADELDPQLPKLRILSLKPDTDPSETSPKYLIATFGKSYIRLPFNKPHELLSVINSILSSYDPDVIQTYFGDPWLFLRLQELSKETGVPFNPNRDLSLPVLRRKEVNFFNYGHAHYRAPQTHLRGRWHVDIENCMTYNQYQLLGAIEQTRFSSLPLQEVARRSPGAAISAMQVLTAVKRGTLIPYQRQKAEIAKSFNEYYGAARGGLVFQPTPGIFPNVAVLDFSSKMASIMIKYNVSPETVVDIQQAGEGFEIPKLGVKILPKPGLVPQALKPMRDKRLALKQLLKSTNKKDPLYRTRRHHYKVLTWLTNKKAVSDALKWLTVVCYGRLGFANSIFGRLNSHETVSYLSRRMITEAKLIAEGQGFNVHHLYVDSLFVSRPDAIREDFEALAKAIEQKTELPMELENVYSWFAFLSSRQNPKISVANRFYGIAARGEHKIRGVALRRGDICSFVTKTQMEVIQILAKEKDPSKLVNLLPEILETVQKRLAALKAREIPLNELVVSQTLSRELSNYSVLSPPAIAARLLQVQGKILGRGQRVRFIYTGPAPGIYALGLPSPLDPRIIDIPKYKELTLRSVHEILQPMGVTEVVLRNWLFSKAGYVAPFEFPGCSKEQKKLTLPIFTKLAYLRVDHI